MTCSRTSTTYATAFGWDKWPAAQLVQNRVSTDGTRGSGSLYAMGLNNSLTGVFYNKKLAQQIGMTEPPKTVADFEALLAKAKSAGLLPIMVWNSAKSGGGLAFPLQQLMAAYGPTQPINDWIFQNKGASIDTPSNLMAAQHLEQWIKSGYFPKDANAIEYTDANARFGKGEGVFMFNGDWQDGGYDKDQPGNVGFFVFPPAEAGGSLAAMSAPLTFGIAKSAKHADCAAVLLQLGRHERQGTRYQREGLRLESWRSGGSGDPGRRSRIGDQGHTRLGRGGRKGKRGDGLHRKRDRIDLRPGLDP